MVVCSIASLDARFPVEFAEQLLYAGTLRRFVLEIDADPDYLATLGKVLISNSNLLEVAVQTKEVELLSQIVYRLRGLSSGHNHGSVPSQAHWFHSVH